MMFEHELLEQARADRRRVVLPEGTEERVLRAADVLLRRDVCDLTLLGDAGRHPQEGRRPRHRPRRAQLIDPQTSELRQRFAEQYAQLRAHKGVTVELAYDVVADVNYFGTLMVQEGLADGMVSGAVHSTAATIRPPSRSSRPQPDASIVSSVFFMCLADRVLVYGDCAVNPDPNAEQLADIAIQSAATAARFGVEPRIAMLSYSTGTSGSGADVDKVREATELVRAAPPGPADRGPDPVRRGRGAVRRGDQAAGLRGGGPGDRADLPRPQHRQQHLQGRAALGRRGRGRAGAAGSAQAGQRPVARRARQDIVNTVAITAIQAQAAERPAPRRRQPPVTGTRVLVLNSGSSSVKYQLLDMRDGSRLAVGLVERIGEETSRLVHTPLTGGGERERTGPIADHERGPEGGRRGAGADGLGLDSPELAAIGHRVVHGGLKFTEPTVITDEVLAEIERLIPVAPLHNPANITGHPYRPGAAPGPAAGRGLRHRVPHHDAGVGGPLRDRRRDRRRAPDPPLRLPRHLARVRLPARRRRCWARPVRGERHRAAPGQWRIRLGGARRPVRGHLDGADAAGGPGDGHPLR